MNYSTIRQIIFGFSLIALIISCQKEPVSANIAQQEKQVFCKIITSSSDNPHKLLDSTLWQSSSIGKDDILIFIFYQPTFINKISISQNDKQITSIRAYTSSGNIGDFSPTSININDTIGFIILKLQKTNHFHLTDGYIDTKKFQIGFQHLNNSVNIQSVGFWRNDSTKLSLTLPKINKKEITSDFNLLNKKVVDYSTNQKSFVLKSSGEIIGAVNDTIFYGFWDILTTTNSLNLSIKKFYFTNNNYKTEKIKSIFSIKENIAEITDFQDFMFDFKDDYFVDIKTLDTTIVLDIRYATDNNFMEQKIYECPFCWLRYGAGKSLVAANKEFRELGYRIKVFDCYRPHSAQYKLWEIMPNINFVANPEKGSIHNRGAAVDLTLIDSFGNQLDMGTEFDYFGYKAFSINLDLSDTILQNRNLLWSIMRKNGFNTIKTEWWHMSHFTCLKYPISELEFPCE